MDTLVEEPGPGNGYHAAHVTQLLQSFHRLTGRHLLSTSTGDPIEDARQIYEAPFFVASHDTAPDPVLTYGNLTALRLFEMSWETFTQTPSRFTAEAPVREERARLLQGVKQHGFIDDYSGVRISASGRRFRITRATVWNLVDESGDRVGQAATFSHWTPLERDVRVLSGQEVDHGPSQTHPKQTNNATAKPTDP